MRFIHAADLHLDTPFIGLNHLPKHLFERIQQATFQALTHLVNDAIEKQVDAVLFSGDIYDVENRSVRAQLSFYNEMERLEEASIPAFVIHGNHDPLLSNESYLSLPSNVHVFGPEVDTITFMTGTGEKVAVTGFSYNTKWVTERKIQLYPKRANVDVHLGMLHGNLEGLTSPHGNYAPFSVSEIQDLGYDYFALGHIHQMLEVSDVPLAYYSGCLQGRHRNERGEKGYLEVIRENGQTEISFQSKAPIVWQSEIIDAKEATTLGDVITLIQEYCEKIGVKKFFSLVEIELMLSKNISEKVVDQISNGELLHALQMDEKWADNLWIHTLDYTMEQTDERHTLQNLFPAEWKKANEVVLSKEVFQEETADFFKQAKFARRLEPVDEAYLEKILHKIKQRRS